MAREIPPLLQPCVMLRPLSLVATRASEHAVRLARTFRSGTDGGDGVDRLRGRPHAGFRSQSRAAVRLHRGFRGLDQRHRLRADQRRHCRGLIRAVLPQPPRHARLRHVGPGPHGAAGDHRRRHRRHDRPSAPEMDRRLRLTAPASRHRGAATGGARPGRHRHRAARCRHPRRIHQPRLPPLLFASRRKGRLASRPSSR